MKKSCVFAGCLVGPAGEWGTRGDATTACDEFDLLPSPLACFNFA